MYIKAAADPGSIIAASRGAACKAAPSTECRIPAVLQGDGVTWARLLALCARDLGGRPSCRPFSLQLEGFTAAPPAGADSRDRPAERKTRMNPADRLLIRNGRS